MNTNKVPLGAAVKDKSIVTIEPKMLIERLDALENQVQQLLAAFNYLSRGAVSTTRSKRKRSVAATNQNMPGFNKDGIPIGTVMLGTSKNGGMHVLTVKKDCYSIGINKYNSLSAAAEESSGVRRSGWTFWKTTSGKTAKEEFGKDDEQEE